MESSSTHVAKARYRLVFLSAALLILTAAMSKAAPMPDLIVKDFWEQTGTIHFTLENIGTSPAQGGHSAFLRVNGQNVDSAYIAVTIVPGKTHTATFNQYSWECTASGQYTLGVRADGTDKVAESNENNNARQEIWTCDVTAPVITLGPLVQYITQTYAKVNWTTDEDSDSVVGYGQVPGQYTHTRSSQQMTTDHTLYPDSLQPDTLYYFRVESTDAAGNKVKSKEMSFRTESEQPKWPDLVITDLWEHDHLITFRIQNAGDGTAEAGHLAGLYIADRLIDSVRVTQTLTAGESTECRFEKFYFQCFDAEHTLRVVADMDDEVPEGIETNNALDKTLVCDRVPLKIVSGPSAQEISTKSAVIVWETNKPSGSTVLYDEQADLFGKEAEDPALTTKHSVTVNNLKTGTVYQFKVRSADASEQSVTSLPGHFQTAFKPDTQPPKIMDLKMVRRDTRYPSYRMEATATDDMGVDKVEFYVDGQLIHTDYTPPYDAVFAPGMSSEVLGEFFRPHPVEAIAYDGGRLQGSRADTFNPPYECNEITAEFEWPCPHEEIYIAGDNAPAGTEVPIQVYATTWAMLCHSLGGVEIPPGSHAAESGMVCDVEYSAVREVRFFVNGVDIGTVPSRPDHTYSIPWNAGGYPLGTHTIRADVVANEECIQTITRDIEIVRGELELDVTRRVWREGNAFRIELTIDNQGTLDYDCDVIQDNLIGLQAMPDTQSHYEIIPRASAGVAHCDVEIDLFDGGASTRLIRAGRTFVAEYFAIPALTDSFPGWVDYPIGREPVEVTRGGGTGSRTFDRPCVRTEDGILLTDEMDAAVETADYLLVTNVDNCQTEFGTADWVLPQMAKLAYHRNGVLGYLDNMIASGFSSPSNASIRDQIVVWGASMRGSDGTAGGYLTNGYLLLVGESEIVPGWTVDTADVTWGNADPTTEARLSDLPYGDVSGADNVPELIVGRIIGNNDSSLIQTMEASLEGGFDRSFGVITTGSERPSDNFVLWSYDIYDVWTDQGADGEIMTDDPLLHHWTAYVHKAEPVSGYDFPIETGDGFVMANIGGLTAVRVDPDSDTASGAPVSELELILTDFTEDFSCPFNAADALAAGDFDGDGEEEIVVGSMSRGEMVMAYDPPHTDGGTYPALDIDLAAGDVVACGQVNPDAPEEIVVAFAGGENRVRVYQYENVGVPSFERIATLTLTFTTGDRLAVGDVDSTHAGDEIIVGSNSGEDIRIYDDSAALLGVIPCEALAANDGMTVGDLDGDGADEIALMVDTEEVDKHTFLVFDNDCWAQEPNGTWTLKNNTLKTIRSRFLNFDGSGVSSPANGGIACSDLDGDGKDEICVAHEQHDRLYVYDAHYSEGWKSRYMPVLQDVDDQIDLLVLCGHGNAGSCSPFGTDDVDTLSLDAHPLVFGLSCLTGYYEGNGDEGLAEHFLSHGAAVYIGSTEVSALSVNREVGPDFFSRWETDETAGQAFRALRRDCVSSSGNYWKLWGTEYNYYGDPKFGEIGSLGVMAAFGEKTTPKAISMTAAATIPGPNETVVIPGYEVTTTGGVDRVTIPGGSILLEYARPMVPYYTVRWPLPAGAVVQDVKLRQRSGLQTQIGLELPIATMMVDTNEVEPPVQPDLGWYPANDLTWQLIQNPDNSATLVVQLYPFFYNSFTTESRFYPKFVIDVEMASPDIRVLSLFTDKPVYEQGDRVTLNLVLNGSGQSQDVFVDAAIRQYGSDELIAGLLLRRLSSLTGQATFSPTWNSHGASAGYYYADVTLVAPSGTVLGRAKYLFELQAPTKETNP